MNNSEFRRQFRDFPKLKAQRNANEIILPTATIDDTFRRRIIIGCRELRENVKLKSKKKQSENKAYEIQF